MERKVVVKEAQPDLLLSGFRLVYIEYLRTDLEPIHREYVEETLNEFAKNCVNSGLGRDLARIKEDVDTEVKLRALKRAWEDGEIEA